MDIALRPLLAKLNGETKAALELAVHFCVSKKKSAVNIEDFLIQLCAKEQLAMLLIFKHYSVNLQDFLKALHASQLVHNAGATGVPSLSQEIVDVIHDAWLLASVELNSASINSGHILLSLLCNLTNLGLHKDCINILRKINLHDLKNNFFAIIKGCIETESATSSRALVHQNTGALEGFTTDLVQAAQDKKVDRAIGRKKEVNQMIDILCRRKQNNPILVGDAGVGKTAIVEELAYRIAEGSVPDLLKQVALRVLDLTALQAGASIKGEFEQRLKNLINEIKQSPKKVLLFIDEIHNLLGVGSGSSGQNDAANLLKPELARGEIFVIGATTWAEYKKYFEKDAALTRRFQLVKVNEPTQEEAMFILRNVAGVLEKHHNVHIMNQGIEEAVKLTSRYLINQQLPDKAITLLDSACAKVKLELSVQPVGLQKMQEKIFLIEQHIKRLAAESSLSQVEDEEMPQLTAQKLSLEELYKKQNDVWESKINLIKQLEQAKSDPEQYQQIEQKLQEIEDESPKVYQNVGGEVVADILSNWTGIPIATSGSIKGDLEVLHNLNQIAQEKVIGQDHAVHEIVQKIKISKANLADPRKPIGVFLLVGGSGVGKTETALCIAEALYGSSQKVVTINMSEYKEAHKISSLIGSPPGYIGYGEGGKLTEKVRRNPYSVVLLDEIEKAHGDIQELFLQVFDKGILTDSEGIDVNFKNTIIIMTSNLGAAKIREYCEQHEVPDIDELNAELNETLLRVFKPEFLGRISVIPYLPLNEQILERIIVLQLNKVEERIKENYKAKFTYDQDIIKQIIARCQASLIGARVIEHIISNEILATLATQLLETAGEGAVSEITLRHGEDMFWFEIVDNKKFI